MSRPELPSSLRVLLEAASSIAGRSQAAKVAIARLDGVVDPDGLPAYMRGYVRRAIERAVAATTDPLPVEDIEKILAAAWDEKPSSVLDELTPEPLAVLPHAQVHRGVLEGDAVAIKVARPGVAAATRSDLVLLDTLAAPARAAFPGSDVGALTGEVRERVLDELDFEHEAQVHRRAARGLRSVDGVSAAAVHTSWCAADVLVTEFVEGTTLADRGALDGADRAAIGRALVKVYAGAPRAIGAVLANPRASDVKVAPGGGIVLTGIGAAREVDPARIEPGLAAATALREDDPDAFATAAVALGVLDDATALEAHRIARELAGDLISGPATLSNAVLAERAERALDRIGDLMSVGVRATPAAADLWPLRCLAQVVPVLARLEVEEDWAALALDAAGSGW